MSNHLGACSEVGRWSEFCVAAPSSRLEVLWLSEGQCFAQKIYLPAILVGPLFHS